MYQSFDRLKCYTSFNVKKSPTAISAMQTAAGAFVFQIIGALPELFSRRDRGELIVFFDE